MKAQILKTIESQKLGAVVYETHAGYRIVLTDRLLAPDSPESVALMKQFKSDKLYAKLCLKHACYRARLSPKPYRIGVEVPKVTVENYLTPEIESWVQAYDVTHAQYGVCKRITAAPDAMILPEVKTILEIHDRFCLKPDLPLA